MYDMLIPHISTYDPHVIPSQPTIDVPLPSAQVSVRTDLRERTRDGITVTGFDAVIPYTPQWYGPLLPDLESFISMVFTAVWMQNILFPWYLHQFGWRTSYFHGMYSILDAKPHISIPTYQHTYIDTDLHTFIPTCIHTYVPR